MSPSEHARRYATTYAIGLAGVAVVAAVAAGRATRPSAALAAVGAGTAAALGYSIALWPATRRVTAYYITDQVATHAQELAATAAATIRSR